jgi:hypothetical protein
MRFTKDGITFNYNDDEITWFWWWRREVLDVYGAYYSLIYDLYFYTFREYWIHVGAIGEKPTPSQKVTSFGWEEVLRSWARQTLRTGFYVVLYDINIESKPASFWRSVPDRDKIQFTKDLVALRCKSHIQAIELCDSIRTDFAIAIVVADGRVQYYQ